MPQEAGIKKMESMLSAACGQINETEFTMLKTNSKILHICVDYMRSAQSTYIDSSESYFHKVIEGKEA